MAKSRLKLLAISNQKGGVAKSTTTVQVGAYLALKGYRTLLVDLDPQANLSSTFLKMRPSEDGRESNVPPVHPEGGSTYISKALFTDDEWLPYETATPNLYVLPASGSMFQEDYKANAIEVARKSLQDPDFQKEFDVVIFDTPPAKGLYTEAAISLATHVLVPCTMEKKPFEGLMGVLQFIQAVNEPQRPEDMAEIIGVLPTMYDSRMRINKDNRARLHKYLGKLALNIEIKRRAIYQDIEEVSKEYPYEVRASNKDAHKEWQALGQRIVTALELEQ